jgi:hypothetical protein
VDAALDWLEKYGDNLPPDQEEKEESNPGQSTAEEKKPEIDPTGASSSPKLNKANMVYTTLFFFILWFTHIGSLSVFFFSMKAKGLKCTECDKFFKNNALASYHSEKSGHINFDEVEYEVRLSFPLVHSSLLICFFFPVGIG